MIDKAKILDYFPSNRKFSINDIAYIYKLKPSDIKKKYKKSLNRVKRITKLYRTIEDFSEDNKTIIIKGNNATRNIMTVVNTIYKKFPVKYFLSDMVIDPRIILYILCTNDRASYLFKLPKEQITYIRSNIRIERK